jgi:hypothetical protein
MGGEWGSAVVGVACSVGIEGRVVNGGLASAAPDRLSVGMVFALLADLTVFVHALFVVFVVTGGFLALRWRHAPWLHLPLAAWGAWVELGNRVCPLTPLENHFRARAGEHGYEGGFLEHYLLGILYPEGLTREIQLVLGGGVIALNLAVYLWVLRRRRS